MGLGGLGMGRAGGARASGQWACQRQLLGQKHPSISPPNHAWTHNSLFHVPPSEMFHDNRKLLDEMPERLVNCFVSMCTERVQQAGYIKFLCELCVCDGQGILKNQSVICKRLLEDNSSLLLTLDIIGAQCTTHPPAYLPACRRHCYFPTCICASLPPHLPAIVIYCFESLPPSLPPSLPTYLPTCLPAYLPACLPACLQPPPLSLALCNSLRSSLSLSLPPSPLPSLVPPSSVSVRRRDGDADSP